MGGKGRTISTFNVFFWALAVAAEVSERGKTEHIRIQSGQTILELLQIVEEKEEPELSLNGQYSKL